METSSSYHKNFSTKTIVFLKLNVSIEHIYFHYYNLHNYMADGNAATDVPTMNQTGPNCRLCEMRVKPRRVLALPLDGAQ